MTKIKVNTLYLIVFYVVVLLAGCSSFRNYDKELSNVSLHLEQGDPDYALNVLHAYNPKKHDLLYYFEKGQLLRLKGDFLASQAAWMKANQRIQQWEDVVKRDPAKYVNNFLAYLWNDKIRRYDGYDYEKVMLTTQMALNFLALNDWSSARVAIRQTHEREAVISQLHELLYLKEKEVAESSGVHAGIRDIDGYPVETLNMPRVLGLKNSYQNAFSHYLAGYIYEALGETDLAAPGYRNAIELKPHTALLEKALKNLAKNVRPTQQQSDVLIVVESGLAPKRESLDFSIPIVTRNGVVQVSISLPVITDVGLGTVHNSVMINNRSYSLTEIVNIDAMSRRALWDELPGTVLRTVVRATTRAITQEQLNREVSPWAGLFFGVMGAVLEQADLRTWRTLPERVQIMRVKLTKGKQLIKFPNGESFNVMINGNYQVIQFVQIGNKIYHL